MASPQVENGHTKFANEILEQLMRIHLSPNQWQVLMCILRKTYGYHKKYDYLTNSQICESTGILKPHVSRALCYLESMNIITRKGKIIGFQKDWEKWKKLSKLVTNTKIPVLVNTHTELPIMVSELPVSVNIDTEIPEMVNNEKLPVLDTALPELVSKVTSPLVTQKKYVNIQKKYIYNQFLKFWETYPKKVGKGNAEKVFLKLSPDDSLFDIIINAVVSQSKSEQWQSDGGKYIPHPATWLNGKRWEDEIKIKGNGHKQEVIKSESIDSQLEKRGIKID
jgi:phage replication O-like protein O